jgi:two-component system, chemotaxis family, response regulator Rcp1
VIGERFLIVLVEDNPADVYLWREALKTAELDFELLLLKDGGDAMTYIQREGRSVMSPLPDLVVLDLRLPKQDGSTVLEALRRNQRFDSVPIVVATSASAPAERTNAERLGVQRFLTKPIELELFLQMGMVLKDVLMQAGQERSVDGRSRGLDEAGTFRSNDFYKHFPLGS